MHKLYHLSTCNTCQRIIRDIIAGHEFELQDIKTEPISAEQLDNLRSLSGSYQSLFSRRARKFRAMGLHEMELTESDYRRHILSEYTFLKRPVAVVNDQIFIGHSKSNLESLSDYLTNS